MLARGEAAEARHLLAMINRVRVAFGDEPCLMPEPSRTDLPNLVTADAGVPLRKLLHPDEPLVEVEHSTNPATGNHRAAA